MRDFATDHAEPLGNIGDPVDRGPKDGPLGLADAVRKAVGNRVVGQLMEQLGIEQDDVGQVEMGRCAAEMAEIELGGECGEIGDRFDRLRSPEPSEQREQRHRLEPVDFHLPNSDRAEPLGQFALGGDEQRFMGEDGRVCAQSVEHLKLDGAVRDMILAADDVADAKVDIVDHARQEIKPTAVGAADDGVAEQPGIELLVAADEVGPADRAVVVEAKAPVGRTAFDGFALALGPLVNWGQAAPEQDFAANVELFGGFEAGVDPSGGGKPVEFPLVKREAVGLTDHLVGSEPKPGEVGVDRLFVRGGRTFGVGVVDPKQEVPAVAPREQQVVERGANVADMEPARRRGGEAGGDRHGGGVSPSVAARLFARSGSARLGQIRQGSVSARFGRRW